MQEYTAKVQNTPSRASGDMKLDDLVLCKIYQTRVKPKNNPQQDNLEEEPDETVVNPALQPHFSQDSMLPLLQLGMDNMLNDAALPQGVDVEPLDISVDDWLYRDFVYNMAEETVPNATNMHNDVVSNATPMYNDTVPNVALKHNDVVPNVAVDEMVPNAVHLQPHFNQSSMHHEVVDYSVSSSAYNSGADMNFGPNSFMGGREHVKSCNSEVEDWIDRAQLNTITYGESSDVILDVLWSED
ncbi:unnamed protein product [Ilex paraguariensis]|uniref:NAC domain-containing protein n=1 Tax=Ilex paraguariensis TaxID=185542 RepID=A0ABC8SEL9_9AQUA